MSHNPSPGARCARELSGVARRTRNCQSFTTRPSARHRVERLEVAKVLHCSRSRTAAACKTPRARRKAGGRKRGAFFLPRHWRESASEKSSEPPAQVHPYCMLPRRYKGINTKAQRRKGTKKNKKAHLNYPLLFFEPLSLRAFVLMKSRQAPPSLPGPTHRRRGSVRSCRGIALDNRPIAYGAQAEAALDHVIQTYYPQGRP